MTFKANIRISWVEIFTQNPLLFTSHTYFFLDDILTVNLVYIPIKVVKH